VGSGVEGVDVIGVGSGIGFAAVDDDNVISPEGGAVTTAFCRWGRRVWQGGDQGPLEGIQVKSVDMVEHYG
jgi:hypothetical protein